MTQAENHPNSLYEKAYWATRTKMKELKQQSIRLRFEFPEDDERAQRVKAIVWRGSEDSAGPEGFGPESFYFSRAQWLRLIRKNLKEISNLKHQIKALQTIDRETHGKTKDEVWKDFGILLD
ncbi:hypothetical protein LU11_gp031 [Pseudomonas phage Lu11]|uniref:hypothetical protein n=1 Tax=Pseudomonas phage Lu11 TaxID=1161927 RepID=UPI00025F14F9|nr:hypothetical protein LU11_gp031 [Pseudomonas phage Lu11]AFH14562.1 hypothetical protein Lu11_0031 [Pseudomonas phage Lu11]